jgi:hypothetical protein
MLGGKQWVGILADQSHAELVYDVMGRAVHVVSQRIGKPVRPSLEEHDFGIERLHTPKRYWIREMALKRRHPGSRQAEVQELVSQRLLQGLTRAADHYSLDCPSLDELGLFMVVTRHIGMPLSTTTGITKEYVTLVNAEVLLHADLSGFWFAGNLTSRGYGRIIPQHPGSTASLAAPAYRESLK